MKSDFNFVIYDHGLVEIDIAHEGIFAFLHFSKFSILVLWDGSKYKFKYLENGKWDFKTSSNIDWPGIVLSFDIMIFNHVQAQIIPNLKFDFLNYRSPDFRHFCNVLCVLKGTLSSEHLFSKFFRIFTKIFFLIGNSNRTYTDCGGPGFNS